jgi:site-specific DNA recombinase
MEASPLNSLRVAIYARVSTEEQKEGQTIDSQVAELERYAREKGWQVVGVYKDEGWSGSLLARPNLDRLRDDASKGLLNAVLINDVDRLARDVTHLGVIKRDLERHGQQVIFRKLPAENSPTHNLLVNILGSFAEFEREMIADRTRRGRRHKVEVRKEFLGSIPPYGFRYVRKDPVSGQGGFLEVNSEEAAVVRQIYRWVDEEGISARKVLERLKRLEIPARKGAIWAKSSVLRVLRSEVYAGAWYYCKYEACVPRGRVKTPRYQKTAKTSRRLRPRTEWLPLQLARGLRIIKRDQWERVQRQVDRNFAFSPRNERHQYLLKGLLRCGACGARLAGQPCHGKFYYRCMARCKRTPSIQEEQLNQVVWQVVGDAMQNPDLIANQLAKLKSNTTTPVASTEAADLEIGRAMEQLQKEEARIIDAYRLGIISPAQLANELEKLQARMKHMKAAKARSSAAKSGPSMEALRRSIEEYCRLVVPRLQRLSFGGRQLFLRALIQEIVFDGGAVRIKGALPVSTNGEAAHSGCSVEHDEETDGNITTMQIGSRGRNGALFSAASEPSLDELGRNVPDENFDEFGNLLPHRTTEPVPFELEKAIVRIQIVRRRDEAGRFVA